MACSLESRWAFKEWAVVCEAIARGRQSILLRKGGIHEERGLFVPEHDRFWLYPTRFHQSPEELISGSDDLMSRVADREPHDGTIALREFILVKRIVRLALESQLELLDGFHILSRDAVRQRFHYREPGLYVLGIECDRSVDPVFLKETPEFAGCKTWVDLEQPMTATVWEPVAMRSDCEALFDRIKESTSL